jgi:hypothetical protein
MYRAINLKQRKSNKYGAYATYFQLSPRRGVKVYGLSEWVNSGQDSIDEVDFCEVEQDFSFIKQIKCEITPGAREIVAVKVYGRWYPGIILDHVDGVHLDEIDGVNEGALLTQVHQAFMRLTGHIHNDLHTYNVLFNKKTMKFKVIDLTVEAVTPSFERNEHA